MDPLLWMCVISVSTQTNLDTSPKSEPALELISRAQWVLMQEEILEEGG